MEEVSECLASKLLLLDGRDERVAKAVFPELCKQAGHGIHRRQGARGYFDNLTFHLLIVNTYLVYNFLTTDGTAAYLLNALPAILEMPARSTGVRPLLLQAYAAASLCTRRLTSLCLVFYIFQKPLRRRPLGKNAKNGPVHIVVALRNMVGMRCRRLHRRKVTEMPHTLKDSVRSLEIGKGRHCC